MAVLKHARDVKNKYKSNRSDAMSSVEEEGKSVRLAVEGQDFVLRNLPCVRFFIEGSDAQPTAATDYVRELLGCDETSKVCMLRMQEPLVCTETDPGRSFKCTLSRDMAVALGVTAEGRNKIGALPKRFQVPTRPEKLPLVLVRGNRGDVFTVTTSPCVSYHVAKSAGAAKTMQGDITIYRNEHMLRMDDILGPADVRVPLPHEFTVQDGICGIAFWVGGLTDLSDQTY
jgi:hypothetical protein